MQSQIWKQDIGLIIIKIPILFQSQNPTADLQHVLEKPS